MKNFFKEGHYWPFFFLLLGIFFIILAPTTVQFGDTSEFATNGYLGRLSHPPGYPIFTYLLWPFTHLIPIGSVFFRASLIQISLSIGTLFIVSKIAHEKGIKTLLLLMILGLGQIYWKYSLLPDVFMLNTFLISLFSLYFFREANKKNLLLSSLIYGLALSNHQTSIFIMPLFLYLWWEIKNIKLIIQSLMISSLTFIFSNLSLLILDDQPLGSWGDLKDLTSLLHHILRKDYGTFTLSNSFGKEIYLFENLGIFLKILVTDYFTLTLIGSLTLASLILKRSKISVKEFLYFVVSLVTFFAFFSLSNVYPEASAGLIIERFYLLPLIMLGIWVIKTFPPLMSRKLYYLLMISSLLNIGSNIFRHYQQNNFRQDNFLQRHYTHLLESLPQDAILIIGGDTHVFSLYYLQEIMNIRKDVIIITPDLYTYAWYRNKLKKRFPNLQMGNYEIKSKFLHENIDNLIIAPNINHRKIFADSYLINIVNFENYHVTHQGIIVEIKKGKSTSMFDCKPAIEAPLLHNTVAYQANLEVFFWYGSCDFLGGIYHLNQKNKELALYLLKRATEKVPYSQFYHQAYCNALYITQASTQDVSNCIKELGTKTNNFFYKISE